MLDDIITSSVVKGVKPSLSQSILQSPVVQSRLQNNDENARFLSKFLNSPVPEKRKYLDRPVENNIKRVSKIGNKISGLSKRLVDTINDNIGEIYDQVMTTESQITTVQDNIGKYEKSYKQICSLLGMKDVQTIKAKLNILESALQQNKGIYIRSIEKSQALKLATLVQKDEEGFRDTASNPNQAGKLRDAVTLTVLQFKKQMWLKRLSEDITNSRSLVKINKYKQLIGNTYDNIDSKLDDIEADLRATG